MSNTYFRVHPAINFARVGNSEKYYLAPETAAGELIDKQTGLFGGLPIQPGTEDTSITEADFRDEKNQVKRQAARFRIFAYDAPQTSYPGSDHGREVKIGDLVNGKTIKDIVWTVHPANKKNNWYKITDVEGAEMGIKSYEPDSQGKYDYPPIRDPEIGSQPGQTPKLTDPERLRTLLIDPGPRAISSTDTGTVIHFSRASSSTYADHGGSIKTAADYPVAYPDDHLKMINIYGPIDSLGEIRIEPDSGRLIVTGGYGRAGGVGCGENCSELPRLEDPIDNDYWFDDTSDGPVNAVVVYSDGSSDEVVGGWVVTTDPGYAPQTRNVVSTWDDMFSAWVEALAIAPEMYRDGSYQPDYKASWESDVLPVFHGAFLQRWNTNLPSQGINGHDLIANIKFAENPKDKIPNFKDLIRDPNSTEEDDQGVKMPLALGDATKSFLSLSPTQYFLLMQWYARKSVEAATPLGQGEKLDKVALENCLGGRYSPGIDLTFIVRDINLFRQNWQGAIGPFRINQETLSYANATHDKPFLGVGYIPLQDKLVQPGDLSKFMSQPWHTDYNSCASHNPDPNPPGNNTLYWSWPAQRPVQVYPKELCTYDSEKNVWNLGGQLYSIRGDGEGDKNLTHTTYPQNEGKYQQYLDYVENWHKVGFVIQGLQVASDQDASKNYGADKFIEVESLFTSYGDAVQSWPTATVPKPESKPDKSAQHPCEK